MCYIIVLQKCCFSVFIVIVAIFGKILSRLFLIDFRNYYVWYIMFLMLGNTFLESFKNASEIFQFCEIFSEQNDRDFSRILISGFHLWLVWRQWNLHLHNLGIISSLVNGYLDPTLKRNYSGKIRFFVLVCFFWRSWQPTTKKIILEKQILFIKTNNIFLLYWYALANFSCNKSNVY